MRKLKRIALLAAVVFALGSPSAFAVPTFQVFIEGSTAADYMGDQQTWFYAGDTPFVLDVVGAFGPNTLSLTDMYLVVSVPDAETGAFTIEGLGTPSFYADTSWMPAGANFNSHYPLQEGVSDFYLFSLGSFSNLGPVNNYNADLPGSIDIGAGSGEQRQYTVTLATGFTTLHFDVFGLETDRLGRNRYQASWDISPGSHDSTHLVPEPGTFLLLGIGIIGVGLVVRRIRKHN